MITRTLAVAAAVALLSAAPTHADPYGSNGGMDPHMPNTWQGYCPGGGFGGPMGYGTGYCDGIHYPDGSYWHQIRGGIPFVGPSISLSCVVDPDGGPFPAPAPHGGCGGAV